MANDSKSNDDERISQYGKPEFTPGASAGKVVAIREHFNVSFNHMHKHINVHSFPR
jgi:hypothetical protein